MGNIYMHEHPYEKIKNIEQFVYSGILHEP